MTFKKSHNYFQNKIERLKRAIEITQANLLIQETLTAITAHKSQLASHIKDLAKAEQDYASWSAAAQ